MTRENLQKITVEKVSTVEVCNSCGGDHSDIEPSVRRQRVLLDLEYRLVEKKAVAEIKDCPECRARTKGRFFENITGPMQYGGGFQALVVSLLVAQMPSLRRAVGLVQAMFGINLSKACSASPLMGTATLKLEATSHSAKHLSQHKKNDLWAQKGTVKAVILFPRFDVAHIHQQCRATKAARKKEGVLGNIMKELIAEGEARGIAKGEAMSLSRLLERRFGPLPATVKARVGRANLAQLDAWIDRVLDAKSLGAVFGVAE